GLRFRFRHGIAEALAKRELAMPGERDLAARIAALGDMSLDQRAQALDLFAAEAQRIEVGLRQRKVCARKGARVGSSIHDWFLPMAIILSREDMSMTQATTCCVLRKPCHNARHVQ